jgi:hypothetical protein
MGKWVCATCYFTRSLDAIHVLAGHADLESKSDRRSGRTLHKPERELSGRVGVAVNSSFEPRDNVGKLHSAPAIVTQH